VGTSARQKLDAPQRMKPEEQTQAENSANRRLGCRSEWSAGGYSLQLTMGGNYCRDSVPVESGWVLSSAWESGPGEV
jgi:hypothetical protein